MTPLAPGIDYLDVRFLGQPGIIATGVLKGSEGIALIDPGPSTTLPALRAALAAGGYSLADVRAILVTHIHLDHSGAVGSMIDECPAARVFVHERGAPHMIDPSKLLVSAARLYGADMERLWGEVRPVPADRVQVLATGAVTDPTVDVPLRFRIVGHDVEAVYTPGHASHHVSFFLPASRIAFVGDTGGICRQSGRIVLPATPPPDIDLEIWQDSIRRILAWSPEVLFLTHFGPQAVPRLHFQDLWKRMDDWSRKARVLLDAPGTDEARAQTFMRDVTAELQRATGRDEAEAYARAGRFDYSWLGLARYWRKKMLRA